MRIAIPVVEGRLSAHFGHCEEFALIDVDPEKREITQTQMLPSPVHQPGLLPRWLDEQGATVIIAGGMGQRAQDLFSREGIQVIFGTSAADPEELVKGYLEGNLTAGDNACDH